MKYFVVSDVHGHYDALINVLKEANYDELNTTHKLIINGDMFDRGPQSKEVYEYLYRLNQEEKAIIIKGNHEVFFEDLFYEDYRSVSFNILYNGFSETLKSFVPQYEALTIEEVKEYIETHYPNIKHWLANLPYYYEMKDYIITHAGLDLKVDDWRKGNWEEAVWTRSEKFFHIDLTKHNINKKVVVGHRFTMLLRQYFDGDPNDHSIYEHHDGQKIGIDAGCYYTKKMNVYIIEEPL